MECSYNCSITLIDRKMDDISNPVEQTTDHLRGKCIERTQVCAFSFSPLFTKIAGEGEMPEIPTKFSEIILFNHRLKIYS